MKEVISEFFKKLFDNIRKDIKKDAPHLATEGIITSLFYHRHKTPTNHNFNERWFDDFHFQKEIFRVKKNILTGSYFCKKDFDKDRIIIFAGAYNKGYHYYLDWIYPLTREGYLVFTFDPTATDESEGKGIKGFPQAIIDLEAAIEFVKKDRGVEDNQIYLVGHSSGAYAAGAIAKDHPNIKRIVMVSPFNSGSDLLKLNGREWAKENIKPYIKYIDAYQERAFGPYARYTVSKSMRYSHSEFLAIQSDSDLLVPLETGIKLFKKKLPNWKRINYLIVKEKGHDDILYTGRSITNRKNLFKSYKIDSNSNNPNNVAIDSTVKYQGIIRQENYLDLVDKNMIFSIIQFIEKQEHETKKRSYKRIECKEV